MKWWSTYSQLSYLMHLVSRYLSIPVTLSFSKRCFASAGLAISELRMQLSGKHLEALYVMHCNKVQL